IGKPSGLITRSADQLRTTCKAARRAKVRTARSAMTAITDWPTPVSKPQSSWLSPIMMPPSSVWRRLAIGWGRKAPVFSVTMIWPLRGWGGAARPDEGRKPRIAQTGSEHHPAGVDLAPVPGTVKAGVKTDAKAPVTGPDRPDHMAGTVVDATARTGRAQRAPEPERIHMTVQRAVDGTGHMFADIGQAPPGLGMVENLVAEVGKARLAVQPLYRGGALFQFRLRQARREAAGLAMGDIDTGLVLQQGRQAMPVLRRTA